MLVNIEHLLGSAYDDQLTGNVQANMLSGGLGNDTLEGAGGADHLDGGAGTNTASYAGSAQGVTVYLATDRQLDNQGGDAQGDVFTNIQNLLGSAYADTLVGDEKNNSLSGGAGDDTLEGGAGGDECSILHPERCECLDADLRGVEICVIPRDRLGQAESSRVSQLKGAQQLP